MNRLGKQSEDRIVKAEERYKKQMDLFKTQAQDDENRNANRAQAVAIKAEKDVINARKEFREEMNRLMGDNYLTVE